MREKLQKLGKDKRYTFTAAFGRTGYKRTYDSSGNEHYQPTIMFTNVGYNDELVTNHLWFNYTKGFAELQELHVGDTIQFDGRVNGYIKQRTVFDYDIQRPTKIKILKRKSKKNNVIPDPYEDRNALIGYIMHANRDFYLANGRPYDPWYVKQYRNWLANAEKYNKLSDKDKHESVVKMANEFLKEPSTVELTNRVEKFGQETISLTRLVANSERKDDPEINKELQYCQNQATLLQKILRTAKKRQYLYQSLYKGFKIKALADNKTYQAKLRKFHRFIKRLETFNHKKPKFEAKKLDKKLTEYQELSQELREISSEVKNTNRILNKYAPSRMAFEYLDETNSSKAKQQKYSQLREELLDLKASLDLFDSDNLKKLTKKTDSFKQYCISIRNITLPLRTKERNELKLQHRYERLQHLINLAQETFDKIDMLNIKDKISPKDLNAYYDAYQEEKELLERAKSNKKELRKHKVFRNAKKKLISKSQPVNSQIKELIKIQNRLALKDKE